MLKGSMYHPVKTLLSLHQLCMPILHLRVAGSMGALLVYS
ncbi:hypothetical protein Gogos_012622 [Gossypium gossypioides]|uniref:Uncharacterized protein n=1 Tax=Gossypium gossypioides TaxID=34282 RepID=A0A7J9BT51_GOSGO|nr:hypothetical protein [Gossypium gossypioides]